MILQQNLALYLGGHDIFHATARSLIANSELWSNKQMCENDYINNIITTKMKI